MIHRVRFIHWKTEEAYPLVRLMEQAGFVVEFDELRYPDLMREVKANPPDVIVIDLSRLPSHGRETGLGFRQNKATRGIPLVFLNGIAEKVARIQVELPDATFTHTEQLITVLQQLPPSSASTLVVPKSHMERFAGTSLAGKLGLKPELIVFLSHVPDDVSKLLVAEGGSCVFVRRWSGKVQLAILFLSELRDLTAATALLNGPAVDIPVWLCWQKKSANPDTLITENMLRDAAVSVGWVDYKVCSINSLWSGIKVGRRKGTH